ncbi:MAG: nickel pincer cofactor biosynthesis protein LarC [Actinomycetota bacterium]|nr:nickel pincer cofactor biosynthesis protein LarC [Actinomycetota bacterium]
MSRLLYIDAAAGVAGDMLLGALLDAGADLEQVRGGLEGLGVEGLALEVAAVERGGIGATQVTVRAPEQHAHRRLGDVRALIDGADLPPRAAARAGAIFDALARAEGSVHRVPAAEVTFHEVGALDAIADVCGIVLALGSLEIDELACSPLPVPHKGVVDAAHGPLPLPAPAALELLRGAALYGVDVETELVTPTGAAVVAALAGSYGPLPALRLETVGYGAGTRERPDRPNLVRVLAGTLDRTAGTRAEVSLLETNLDDLPGELVPDALARCTAAGALDVWTVPVQMKKGRPGIVLSALCRRGDESAVAGAMLRHTTALGVRIHAAGRVELERRWHTVEVGGEPVRVKLGTLDGDVVNVSPEHDDCARVAERLGMPVGEVWARALAARTREAVQ